MRIVIGRGRNRTVYELPAGRALDKASRDEPEAYQELRDNVCRLVGVPTLQRSPYAA